MHVQKALQIRQVHHRAYSYLPQCRNIAFFKLKKTSINSQADLLTTGADEVTNAYKESAALLPMITDKSATPTDSILSIFILFEYVNI